MKKLNLHTLLCATSLALVVGCANGQTQDPSSGPATTKTDKKSDEAVRLASDITPAALYALAPAKVATDLVQVSQPIDR